MPAHLGRISDSCPPQLTAMKKCFSDSQNPVIDSMVPFFNVNVNRPHAPLICSCARLYWGNDASSGKITSPTFGCVFRNKMTSFVVRVIFSNRGGKVLKPRISSHALKGEIPLPILRYSLSNIFLIIQAEPDKTPPKVSLWPQIYFVAVCILRSMPTSIGF